MYAWAATIWLSTKNAIATEICKTNDVDDVRNNGATTILIEAVLAMHGCNMHIITLLAYEMHMQEFYVSSYIVRCGRDIALYSVFVFACECNE